jgi:hypothetical protein
MTYVEIWKARIAAGEATRQEAYAWLLSHWVFPAKAQELLDG